MRKSFNPEMFKRNVLRLQSFVCTYATYITCTQVLVVVFIDAIDTDVRIAVRDLTLLTMQRRVL